MRNKSNKKSRRKTKSKPKRTRKRSTYSTKQFKSEKAFKSFLLKKQSQKTIRRPIKVTYNYYNTKKTYLIGKDKNKTIDKALVHLRWLDSKDGFDFVTKEIQSLHKETLLTITFNTSEGRKSINKVISAQVPRSKEAAINAAREQYKKIYNIYGLNFIYPIKVTKKELILITKASEIEEITKEQKRKVELSNKKYYVVEGKIYKYKK